jgi:uncharacterized membrane protein
MLLLILIGFFALIGFAVSGYIFLKKQKHEKLVCFVGDDCNTVINSKYNSLFFGIPNEVMGLGYYAAVFAGVVLLFLGVRYLGPIPFLLVFLSATAVSALFALYLLYVQYIVLKEWCEYCVTSAIASIAIFVLTLIYAVM